LKAVTWIAGTPRPVLRNAADLQHPHRLCITDFSSPDPLHILPLHYYRKHGPDAAHYARASDESLSRWMFAILVHREHHQLVFPAANRSKSGRKMHAFAVSKIIPKTNEE
jgi:hypothetical protein